MSSAECVPPITVRLKTITLFNLLNVLFEELFIVIHLYLLLLINC